MLCILHLTSQRTTAVGQIFSATFPDEVAPVHQRRVIGRRGHRVDGHGDHRLHVVLVCVVFRRDRVVRGAVVGGGNLRRVVAGVLSAGCRVGM